MKKIEEENQIKFYLKKQRLSRILNIKEINNLLNLDDDGQEKEKDIICNIHSKHKSGSLIEFGTKKRKSNKTRHKSFKKYKKNK